MVQVKSLQWEVGFSKEPDSSPDTWIKAEVPGAVQLDWARSHGWGPYYYADNYKEYQWMEDVYWTYRTPLDGIKVQEGRRIFFISKGIDYAFEVRVNGILLHSQEGMFTPVQVDITEYCRPGNHLTVHIRPVPKSIPDDQCRNRLKIQANQSVKPAVSYEWDFHPRLVPLGIWDDTYLEIRPDCHLQNAEVFCDLSEDLANANFRVRVNCSTAGRDLQCVWEMKDSNGVKVAGASVQANPAEFNLSATVDHPKLWWPNGQGEQHLYVSEISLIDGKGVVVDKVVIRTGARRVRLVMHPTAWKEPATFPKTRSTPPITMEINGRRIFCKGSNWVSPEIFPGLCNKETYSKLIGYAKDAHFNIFRCWGGAIVQKEAFFDICDELGIMVWQEFPLACNNYKGTPEYLKVLDQESKSIIRRLRTHASVVLWCGGNELFNEWSGMTDQDLALRLLNRNTFDEDPGTPFLPTSPVMGMAHGGYMFSGYGKGDVYELYRTANFNAYTEFGCDSPLAPAQMIRELLPPEDSYERPPNTPYTTERAARSMPPDGRMKICGVEEYFGKQPTLEAYVEKAHLLQGEGLRCIFEEARRQKPRCSFAVNWCFNEPWPALSNQSIVAWGGTPKPSIARVKDALRPVLASARIPQFRWKTGELFTAEMWLLSDLPEEFPEGIMRAFIRIDGNERHLCDWTFDTVPSNTNRPGPVCRYMLPDKVEAATYEFVLKIDGRSQCDSVYVLRIVNQEPKSGTGWSG